MKVAIYSRVIESDQHPDVQQLFDELAKKNIEIVISHPFYETIRHSLSFSKNPTVFNDSADLDASIDFLISLGGDGTLLDTVTLVKNKNIPVLGINFGRLGFLASIGMRNFKLRSRHWIDRTYVIDKRSLIHLDANKILV